MSVVLFMSANHLKDNYVVDSNVDERIVRSCIYNAQRFYIERYIGTKLYERIESEIVGTMTTDIQILLDKYLVPALKHYAMAELINQLAHRATQKGMITKQADRSDAIDIDTLFKLRKEEVSKGDYYANIMHKFLCANGGGYPEFHQNDGLHQITPSSGFNTDIWLGGGNTKDSYHCNC